MKAKNTPMSELFVENASENQGGNVSTGRNKDYDITSAQELKIINIILESIKVNSLFVFSC